MNRFSCCIYKNMYRVLEAFTTNFLLEGNGSYRARILSEFFQLLSRGKIVYQVSSKSEMSRFPNYSHVPLLVSSHSIRMYRVSLAQWSLRKVLRTQKDCSTCVSEEPIICPISFVRQRNPLDRMRGMETRCLLPFATRSRQ